MQPSCFLDSFCRRCDVFRHHLLYSVPPTNPAMPIGGFIKASLHPRRLPRTRADFVALPCTSRLPVASHNVYEVLDTQTGDDDPAVNDLDVPPLDLAVMDTLNTHDGCTTLALTNSDMFAGSSNTAYLDSGNQHSAVLQSTASLDELESTTGHLNGAVAGSWACCPCSMRAPSGASPSTQRSLAPACASCATHTDQCTAF
jgi:hypothetical protein